MGKLIDATGSLDPLKLIRLAIKEVPATRYALAIAVAMLLISSVGSAAYGIGGTFVIGLASLVLMILMFIVAGVAGLTRGQKRLMAHFMAWSFLILFVGSAFLSLTCLFADWPKPYNELANDVLSLVSPTKPGRTSSELAVQHDSTLEASDRVKALQESTLVAAIDSLETPTSATKPRKLVVRFSGGLYKTVSHWSRGSTETWCQAELRPVDGMTIIGGEETKRYDSRGLRNRAPNPRGCAPAGHCDSHNEYCVTYYRTSGCYVATDWLMFYTDSITRAGVPRKDADICEPS